MTHTDNPVPPRDVHFDPSEMRVMTKQDRDKISQRYNERLQVARPGPEDKARTIVYIGQGTSFMRVVNCSRVGDSQAWIVAQETVINLDPSKFLSDTPAAPVSRHSAISDVTSKTGEMFMCSPFTPMSADQFGQTYGHTFISASS